MGTWRRDLKGLASYLYLISLKRPSLSEEVCHTWGYGFLAYVPLLFYQPLTCVHLWKVCVCEDTDGEVFKP